MAIGTSISSDVGDGVTVDSQYRYFPPYTTSSYEISDSRIFLK